MSDLTTWIKAIITNNAHKLEPYHTIPKRGEIIAKYHTNGQYKYAEVRGHKASQNKLLIREINLTPNAPWLDSETLPPKYIDFQVIENNVICPFNFKLKPKQFENEYIQPIQQNNVYPFPMPEFLQNIPEIIIQTNTIEKEVIPVHIKNLLKNTEQDCPICFTAIKDMKITDCGHIFCSACLDHWVETKDYNETKNDDCPTCRKKL
jgi:hypothetical protein